MSSHRDDVSGAHGRRPGWRQSPTVWVAVAFIFADILVVADSLWWHALTGTSRDPTWRRLPQFFVNVWNESVEHSSVDVLQLALASSQASLLALWACLGRRRWALRWSAAAAGIGYCVTVLAAGAASGYQPGQGEVLFAAQAMTIVVLAMGLRLFGWRLSAVSSPPNAQEASGRRMQFAVQDLIAGTAVIAVLLWLLPNLLIETTIDNLRRAFSYRGAAFLSYDPRPQLVWMAASGMLCGAVAALGARLLLRPGNSWLRLALFGLASWAAARIMILGFVDFNIYARERMAAYVEPGPAAPYVAWICLQAAMLAMLLVALRRDGLRLAKRAGVARASEESASNFPKKVFGTVLASAAILLLVLSAAVFDDVVSWIAGDRELRRAATIVNSQLGRGVSAFCFCPDDPVWLRGGYDWWDRGRPAVGARLTPPIDLAALESLHAADSLEGLWLDGEISRAAWQEILRFPNLKLLCLTTDGKSAQITDRELKQLTTLVHLQHLELTSADISDEGLMHLASLPNLVSVHLKCRRITVKGETEFRRVRPRTWLTCELSE